MNKKLLFPIFLFVLLAVFIAPVFFKPQPVSYASPSQGITRVQGPERFKLAAAELSDRYRVNATLFIIDFFKGSTGYNTLYNGSGGVLVYDDRIVLEYMQKSGSWKQRGTPQYINWTVIDDYTCEVDRFYNDYLGTTYLVKYRVISSYGYAYVKITVTLNVGQNDTYRLKWSPNGITFSNCKNGTNCVKFGEGFGSVEFDWSDVAYSFGNITQTSVSSTAQGRKAEICFNIGSLTAGQKIVLDPITRVQGNARGTTTGNTITVTLGSTPVSGNVLVAAIGTCTSSPPVTVSSITQTNVNWTMLVSKYSGDGLVSVGIFFGEVGANAGTTITITLSGNANNGGVADVCEYSGIASVNYLDQTATNIGLSTTTPSTGTTATTSQPNELWVGATVVNAYAFQSSPTNGFTLLDGAGYQSTSLAYLEKIVSSTGQAGSSTTISSAAEWVGCIATLRGETAPNAPTLNSPTASYRFNPGASVTFSWTFSDPDSGDSQSAYQLQIGNSGFTTIYVDTGKVTSSSTSTTVTLPSTVGIYYWRVSTWDTYGGVQGAWSAGRAIIVDRIKVNSLTADDTRRDVGSTVTISVQLIYEYDSGYITSGTFTLNGLTLSYSGSNGVWRATDSKSTVQAVTYNSVSGTEGTYSLTTVNMNSQSVTVIWDGLKLSQYILDLQNQLVKVQTVYAYDNQPIANANVSYAGLYVLTNSTGWAVFNMSALPSVGWNSVAYPVSEPAYGLTYKTQNQTVAFHKLQVQPFTIRANNFIGSPVWDDVNRKLTFTTSGTCIVKTGDWGQPLQVEVDGAVYTNWTYNSISQEVSIFNLHSNVALIWQSQAGAPGGAPGGVSPTPAPTPTPSPPAEIPPAVPTPPLQLPLATVGIVLIVAVVSGAYVYSQAVKPKTVDSFWKHRKSSSSRQKNPTWRSKANLSDRSVSQTWSQTRKSRESRLSWKRRERFD